jgi:hypothetical protein
MVVVVITVAKAQLKQFKIIGNVKKKKDHDLISGWVVGMLKN